MVPPMSLTSRCEGMSEITGLSPRDANLLRGMQDPVGHDLPAPEIGVPSLQPEPLGYLAIESLLQEAQRDLVDRLDVRALDHAPEVDIAEERDLPLDVGRDRLFAA